MLVPDHWVLKTDHKVRVAFIWNSWMWTKGTCWRESDMMLRHKLWAYGPLRILRSYT